MTDFFVFIHIEIGVCMVMRNIESIEGFKNLYGPNSLDNCLRWIVDHSRNNYWILKNEETGDITIIRGVNHHTGWIPIFGPTSLDGCLVWINKQLGMSEMSVT
jgi:hypothetical protein